MSSTLAALVQPFAAPSDDEVVCRVRTAAGGWHLTRVADRVWKLADAMPQENFARPAHFTDVDWALYRPECDLPSAKPLTPDLLADLQTFAVFQVRHEGLGNATRRKAQACTVVGQVKALAGLFSSIVLSSCALADDISSAAITKLADIGPHELSSAIADVPYSREALVGLKKLLNALLLPGLRSRPGWNADDLATLPIPKRTRDGHHETLSDAEFAFVSRTCEEDVHKFAVTFGLATRAQCKQGPAVRTAAQGVGLIRAWRKNAENNRLTNKDSKVYRRFAHEHGIEAYAIRRVTERAHIAALCLVSLYAGWRRFESYSIARACVRKRFGLDVIVGRVRKDEPDPLLGRPGEWVAIPIVIDSLAVLRFIATHLTKSKYLFTSLRYARPDSAPVKASSWGYHKRITRYLKSKDQEGLLSRLTSVSPYVFRHSLASQLRKAGLGLPYITAHLKHAHLAKLELISKATPGYGRIGADAVASVAAGQHANEIVHRALFDPEAPIAGGGADAMRQKRKEYFVGLQAAGFSKDQIFKHILKMKIPVANLGLTYCFGGNNPADPDYGSRPCVAGVRCNPVSCKNGVITEQQKPMWARLRLEAQRRAEDPAMTFAKALNEEVVAECDKVLQELKREKK